MAKKVEEKTIITQIIQDGYYKPKSPVFTIANDGFCDLLINNSLRLLPGAKFGVSADEVVAYYLEKGYEVVNNTQYHITFDVPAGGTIRQSAQLIETFIKLT